MTDPDKWFRRWVRRGMPMAIIHGMPFVVEATKEREMFEVGDRVQWTSQAQGFTKKKVGTVIAVVDAFQFPDTIPHLHQYRDKMRGWGINRNHISYVVKVGSRVYWPRARYLSQVP